MSPLRAELEMLLDHLDETQTRQMLAIARILYTEEMKFDPLPDLTLPPDYRVEEDPAIGLIDGPPDLAIRAEEILSNGLINDE